MPLFAAPSPPNETLQAHTYIYMYIRTYIHHFCLCVCLCVCVCSLQAIWEWGYPARKQWHPFERDINIQLEEMYDSGSQWVEMTLCLPSPMPFLLDLHDMKLVNFRTAAHYSLRRTDNSDNITYGTYVCTYVSYVYLQYGAWASSKELPCLHKAYYRPQAHWPCQHRPQAYWPCQYAPAPSRQVAC